MTRKTHEILGAPPQFHEDGAPEYVALPDEYNRFAPIITPQKSSSRLMRIMLLLASAGLAVLGILFHASSPDRIQEPSAEAVSVSSSPVITGAPTPVPLSPTPSFTAVVSATPQATPQVSTAPAEKPAMDILFFVFSAEYHIHLQLHDTEELVSAEVSVRDETLDLDIFSHELSSEELASGSYVAEPFWSYDKLQEHMSASKAFNTEPDFVLNATAVYQTREGEVVLTEKARASSELGWSVRYDSPELEANDYTFPGHFSLRTYELEDKVPTIFVNDSSALSEGALSISISVNKTVIEAEDTRCLTDSFSSKDKDGKSHVYYSAILLLPRPASFPEHGTAHITVTQHLTSYDQIVVFEWDQEY